MVGNLVFEALRSLIFGHCHGVDLVACVGEKNAALNILRENVLRIGELIATLRSVEGGNIRGRCLMTDAAALVDTHYTAV